MGVLVVDDALGEKLATATEPVEVRTTAGRLLGNFTPGPICPWDPTLTMEEIRRISDEEEGYTLDEILRELEQR